MVELTVAIATPLLNVIVPSVIEVFVVVLPTLNVDAFTVIVLENICVLVQLYCDAVFIFTD